MSNDRQTPKQYETWLIQLLRRRFEQARFKVEDHFSVGELPLEIDMIVITAEEETKPDFSQVPPLFHYFRRYNVMELKTEGDRLEIADLLKLQAYGWLYMIKKELRKVADMTLTALVHHLSPTILDALPELGYRPTTKGVFKRDSDMVSYLIVFNELPDEITPEELQAFSNPKRRQRLILSQLANRQSSPLLEAVLELYESEVQKMINIKEDTLERLLKGVDQDRLIAAFTKAIEPEKFLAALKKEDMIAALGEKEILKSLREKLGPEKFQLLIDQVNRN
jgi:hypothetical protein